MFSSLPDYRRFAESALPRLRKDQEQKKTNRLSGMLLNILLLTGLWALPLYARCLVLANLNSPQDLSKDVLGKWQRDDRTILEFTWRGQLRLIGKDGVVESADYRIAGDILEVSGFTRQADDRPLPVNQQRYRIAIRGKRMFMQPALTGFTSVPERASEEGSSLRLVLPPWQSSTAHFQRADDD